MHKLGIVSFEQLDRRPPDGIVCKVRVTLKREDDGTERNGVGRFEVIRIEPPEADAFAPCREPDEPPQAYAFASCREPGEDDDREDAPAY